jgi:hypothetical protein
LSSSSGPVIPIRWCRLRAEMRRAAAVIVRSGLSTRPAISQPRPTETTAIMPSAIPDSMSSWSSVARVSPAPFVMSSWLVEVPGPLVYRVNVCGSRPATRKYVMTSRHAAEARNRPM